MIGFEHEWISSLECANGKSHGYFWMPRGTFICARLVFYGKLLSLKAEHNERIHSSERQFGKISRRGYS